MSVPESVILNISINEYMTYFAYLSMLDNCNNYNIPRDLIK